MKWLSFSVITLLSAPVVASQRVGVLHGWRAVGTDHAPSLKAVTL
ncbi:glucose/mannose transport system substrate-binding protein [Aeromonas hydrophila]|nr:glucose/mannose transport system substrate-binding protein [Aeromonas hydrophila]MCS3794401.1 glucose/mannose transport system substrate-binding protein [Aeromonas hydrophila]